MRFTPLLRNSRAPQNEKKVPFQAILPLKLRSTVTGKGEKTSDVSCLQEMAVLFICLKEKDFNESMCSKEVQQFQICYKASLEKKALRKQAEAAGTVGATPATATPNIINRILRRFPPRP
ncbi:coiled-coil-helix-coiled-coil-helix domain-containing protein 1 isoform X2 [Athalia rosae]|uniref:coiled-coil-helix-coiled-coil-helix domain-containing protein 1 isoform X1 n=1 Tax=Athalia rosae TaxID=37344 RepID=UPI0020339FEF|nr:coiled-coil-helix-coiled-coil-helix domain-containing protein 1 isoform X1 [Athalia rosae]XP_012252412.2 coiled-coil-helix-coiled-coil-helix domain-containing protein 1 isoform X1 [Athalia rosae]XP_012252413.2 coiled-coil-helix-coiled-coil-helix domain-containing protein 1 isoform X1 [Athalia rosae]XP_048511502.1 coiled-coil-helix-coiled-coil-helix domain-containing protein 1 isoform X1 [Athalia rosae]XP_048511503.1 coiled-coil-helix-coiled-coil-helix domain-containing protein 1 isoform X2 [